MNTPKTNNPALQKKNASFFWLLLFILLVFSALGTYKSTVKGYSIFNRSWGFDHIHLYGTNALLTFFFACLVLILPYSNNLLRIGLNWLADKLALLAKQKILLFLLIAIAFSYIFYLLNVKYFFLGDFNLRMIQTMKKEFVATEYLTMRLLYAFTTFGAKYGYTHEQLFKLYSYIAGGFFVFTSLLIANLTGKTVLQKILFFSAQLGSSLVLVFCGYVEVYATPVMLLSLYLFFGLRYLKSGKGFIFVLLSLAIAIASHLLCLAALPSFLVAWYFRNKDKVTYISSMSNKKIAFFISVLTIVALIVAFKTKSNFLLTLSPPSTQPKLLTLFNYRHFWELFNGEILCCGLSFIFIFIVLIKILRDRITLLSEHYFLLSVSGGFFLLVFIANLQRGSGDWDIMAFPAVSLNLTTMLLIAHCYRNQPGLVHYLLIAIIGLNSINAFLWLQVNHTDKSIAKIREMLLNDPGTYYTARISGVIQLAIVYTNNKLMKDAESAALLACTISAADEVRSCVMYGLSLKNSGKTEEAKVFFEDLLQNRTPYIYEAYLFLLEYYEKKKVYYKFDYYLNLFFDSFSRDPHIFMNNVNFKASVPIKLFDILYKVSLRKNDQARLAKIQEMINALRELKPTEQKK